MYIYTHCPYTVHCRYGGGLYIHVHTLTVRTLYTVHCRYGGGPMVPKLEVCSVCKALLDEYGDHRKREKEEVYKVLSCYRRHCCNHYILSTTSTCTCMTLVVDSVMIIAALPSA